MTDITGETIQGSKRLVERLLKDHGTAILVTPDGNVRVLQSERAKPIEVQAAELAAENHRRVIYSQPLDVLMHRRFGDGA